MKNFTDNKIFEIKVEYDEDCKIKISPELDCVDKELVTKFILSKSNLTKMSNKYAFMYIKDRIFVYLFNELEMKKYV